MLSSPYSFRLIGYRIDSDLNFGVMNLGPEKMKARISAAVVEIRKTHRFFQMKLKRLPLLKKFSIFW